MNLNNQSLPDDLNSTETNGEPLKETDSLETSTTATTSDIPEFGWSDYAERINGRFAMLGFVAILMIEALSQISFLEWAGILSK